VSPICIILALTAPVIAHAAIDALWARYDSSAGRQDDSIAAMVTDAGGNVYVTGMKGGTTPSDLASDFATAKYNSSGTLQWRMTYSGAAAKSRDGAIAIALDNSGYVYVAGTSQEMTISGTNANSITTIKYDGATGAQQWVKAIRLDGVNVGSDEGAAGLAYDTLNDRIYACGTLWNGARNEDYILIRYVPSTGDTVAPGWISRWDGGTNNDDNCTGITIAGSNPDRDPVLCGYYWNAPIQDVYDWGIVRCSTANGKVRWARPVSFNNAGDDDEKCFGICSDPLGNIYATGYLYVNSSSYTRFMLVKIAGNNSRVDTGLTARGDDDAWGIRCAYSRGRVYAILSWYDAIGGGIYSLEDWGVISFDTTSPLTGRALSLQWRRWYDGGYLNFDKPPKPRPRRFQEPGTYEEEAPTAMAFDKQDRLYVAGYMIRADGNQYWHVRRFENPWGPGSALNDSLCLLWFRRDTMDSRPYAIAIRDTTLIYVGGYTSRWNKSNPADTGWDQDQTLVRFGPGVQSVVLDSMKPVPPDTVDPGYRSIGPEVYYHNNGSQFASPVFYLTDTGALGGYPWPTSPLTGTQVGPGSAASADFDSAATWIVGGLWMMKCTMVVAGDTSAGNNRKTKYVFVRTPVPHDVGATAIKAPTGAIDSGTVVTPACSLYNYGTASEAYTARMKIGASYNSTASVSGHAAGAYVYVTFPTWTALPRDSIALSCSTELSGDMTPANDKKTGNVTVVVRDAECISITAPTGSVDSGATVTPQASIRNNGTASATFDVVFTIGSAYTNTQNITLAAGATQAVSFVAWTATVRGAQTTKCTTKLASDMIPANDFKTGAIFVQTLDAEVVSIAAPAGTVDSGTAVIPQANVRNNGNTSQTFNVRFDIGLTYTNTQPVTLAGGASELVSFASWTGTVRGPYLTRCTTLLSGDMTPANNVKTGSVEVIVHDVGPVAILAPAGSISPGWVTPRASVRNYGTVREPVDVSFTINSATPYLGVVNLPSGIPLGFDTTLEFTSWNATTPGNFTARCSTYLARDQVLTNNVISQPFTVGNVDVSVVSIDVPTGTIESTLTVTPRVTVRNNGDVVATFRVFLRFTGPSPYSESTLIADLSPSTPAAATFAQWAAPHLPGGYAARCSVYIASDQNHANDTLSSSFTVIATRPETGWAQKADAPLGPKNKRVKDGGCLAYSEESDATGFIYAFKGNNRCEFYKYNITDNAWFTKESIPAYGASGRKKAVKKGASMTKAGDKLYATKGNNSLEFWRYAPAGADAYPWTQLTNVPFGLKNIKEGSGSVTVAFGETTYVYLLKGSGTREFYRFNILTNTWEPRADAPAGTSGKTFKNGSCITFDGANAIYALKASYNEFFAYNCSTNTWNTLTALPFIGNLGKKKKVKDGAGVANHGNVVYALKGGNTLEFWFYRTDSGKWTQGRDMPIGGGKRVKGGGALVYAAMPNALFAFKGNNTFEFWRYGLSSIADGSRLTASDEIQSSSLIPHPSSFGLSVAPNPFTNAATITYTLPKAGTASLKLYDVTGQLVQVLTAGHHTAGASSFIVSRSSLSSGIYLLKLETENATTTAKLIIE
jgi:hypothetical protein